MADSLTGSRHNTGSTSSDDRPPPLPPKPTRRFGLGLSKTTKNVPTPPMSPGLSPGLNGPGISAYNADVSPPRVNKPSRVFGSSVSTPGDGLDAKLATLRGMGFPDEKRNSQVLKGLNGNLEKTVEALIRLGEQSHPKSRSTTPTPPEKPVIEGLSFDKMPASTSSSNPFDALDAVPQPQQPLLLQTQLPYTSMSATTTPSNAYNPFLLNQSSAQQQRYPHSHPNLLQQQQQQQNPYAQQQQQSLEQSFQNLQVANQQPQQLFPNRTGGYGEPQTTQYHQTNPFQHAFTPPPVPQISQQYGSFFPPQQTGTPPVMSPNSTGASNPFLKSVKSQIFTPTQANYNPFGQASLQQPQPFQPQTQNPFMGQQSMQQQQPQAQNSWQSQQQAQGQGLNPWQNQQAQNQNPWQNQQSAYTASQPQPAYQVPQPTGLDKNSIMALYNYPHLAPQQPQQASAPATQQQAAPSDSNAAALASNAGSLNPFAASNSTSSQTQQPPRPSPLNQVRTHGHVSNESVDFAGLMGGRHSPDAFSGLSSSFRR